MAKTAHRKSSTRRKSTRGSHAAKPRARRAGARPRSTGERSIPIAAEPEITEVQKETEDQNIQAQARVREDDSEDEAGAYDEETGELG